MTRTSVRITSKAQLTSTPRSFCTAKIQDVGIWLCRVAEICWELPPTDVAIKH